MNPINVLNLSDLEFFLDYRLSEYNVYQFTIVTPSIEDVISDLFSRMGKYSSDQLLQQLGSDFARVTFVSHISPLFFIKHLESVVSTVSFVHKCKIVFY